MKRKKILNNLLCFLVLNIHLVNAYASPKKVEHYVTALDVTSYSPTQSIKSFTDDWNEPLQSGDYAFAQGKLKLGMEQEDGWRYGLNWRYDYMLDFTQDSADIYWRYQNEKLPKSQKKYDLNVEVNHSNRAGFSLGKSFDFLVANVFIDTNLYKSTQFVDGQFKGEMTTKKINNLPNNLRDLVASSNAFINYLYHKPQLKEEELEWNPKRPEGYGASVDLGLSGDITPRLSAQIAAYDVFGFIMWEESPNTVYRLRYSDSTRPPYDLEGKLSTKHHKQTIPWHVDSKVRYQVNDDVSMAVDVASNEFVHLLQLSAEKKWYLDRLNTAVSTKLIIEPQTHSAGISLKHKNFSIKYMTDTLKTNKAKRADIALVGRFDW